MKLEQAPFNVKPDPFLEKLGLSPKLQTVVGKPPVGLADGPLGWRENDGKQTA